MKRLIPFIISVTGLLAIVSCQKPPARLVFKEIPSLNSRPETLGSGVTNGKTPDDYGANLQCADSSTHRGLRAWRRLSNIEIKNTVIDVFKISDVDISILTPDIPKKETFDTMSIESNFLNSARFLALQSFAKTIAAKISLTSTFPCIAEGSSCVSKQLPGLLAAAWRRAPTNVEGVSELSALYSALVSDGYTSEEAARQLFEAIILSQSFLYRSELGTLQADNSFLLTDYEIASALSYTLWRRPPSAELYAKAANGELSAEGAIRPLATKMMDDPIAKEAWKDFGGQWLDAARINSATKKEAPQFTKAVQTSMFNEVSTFVSDVMFTAQDKTFKALITSEYSPADSALDSFYGAVSSNGKTPYAQPKRRGLLGQSGFLASHSTVEISNPITRGAFIAERLLCNNFVGAPPTTAPAKVAGVTTKNIFRPLTQATICQSCHATIDDIGFALENFDYLGRFRTVDEGEAIVSSGKINLDGVAINFANVNEMIDAIASSKQAQQCFVREAFRYGFGRTEFYWRPIPARATPPKLSTQGELDRCQIQAATESMIKNGGDLKTAIIELVSNPAFRLRLKGKVETMN